MGFALLESELEAASTRLRLPLDDWTALGSRFGEARGSEHVHAGIDFDLGNHPMSTVVSPCTGFILSAGFEREFGLNMLIDCGDGWTVRLAYLGELLATSHGHPGRGEDRRGL